MKKKKKLILRILPYLFVCSLVLSSVYGNTLLFGKASDLLGVDALPEAAEDILLPDGTDDVLAQSPSALLASIPDEDILQEETLLDSGSSAAPEEPNGTLSGGVPEEILGESTAKSAALNAAVQPLARAGGTNKNRTVAMDFSDLQFGSDNPLSSKRAVYPLRSSRLIVTDSRQDSSLGDWSLRVSASAFHPVSSQRSPFSDALYLNGTPIDDQAREIISAPASNDITSVDILDNNKTGWSSGFEVILDPGQASQGDYKSVLTWEVVYAPFVESIAVLAYLLTDTSTEVIWTEVEGAEYWIYQSVGDNSNYQLVGTVFDHITPYREQGLAHDTTYFYRVDAVRDGAVVATDEAFVTTGKIQPPMDIPVVTATGLDTSRIYVQWNDIAGSTGYLVYCSDQPSGPYALIADVPSNVYIDSGLPADTGFYYKVEAYNTAGTGPRSDAAYGRTKLSAPSAVPPNVRADGISTSEIQVTWNSVPGATGYYVYRSSTPNGTYSQVATTTSTSWLNDKLPENTGYYYKVAAFNNAGTGPQSAYAYGKTKQNPPSVAPPNVRADGISTSEIQVTWNSVPGATGYYVYRSSTPNGTYSQVATTTSTSWLNDKLPENTGYYYKVTAFNNAGTGPQSAYAYGKTKLGAPAAAPINVRAEGISTTAIKVSWNAVSGATGYYVYRSNTQNGTYSKVGTVGATTSWTNTGLPSNTGYYYKVEAFNTAGTGPRSTYAYGKTKPVASTPTPPTQQPNPPQPSGPPAPQFWVRDFSGYGVSMYWTYTVGKPYPQYAIYRATSSGGPFTKVVTYNIGSNPVTGVVYFTHYPLTQGTTYYFKIASIDANGNEGPMSSDTRYFTVGTPNERNPGRGDAAAPGYN